MDAALSCGKDQPLSSHPTAVNLALPSAQVLRLEFFRCQCWQTVLVTLESHERSLASSKTSDVAKNLMPLGGGLPSGFSNRDDTRIGTSCGWQPSVQAVCSTVRRAGG